MKKEARKEVLLVMFLVIMSIFTMTLVSAAYGCSNSSFITGRKEIRLGEKQTINGLGIGLAETKITAALGRVTTELLVDSRKVLLSNSSSSEEIEIRSGEYTVSLGTYNEENATIGIDGSYKSIGEGEEIGGIGGLEVYLVSSEEPPGEIEVLVGKKELILSNYEHPSEIVTIDGIEYLVELFSGSSEDAIIVVKKCEDGGEILNETISTEPDITNDTIVNDTTPDTTSSDTTSSKPECSIAGFIKEGKYCSKDRKLVELKDYEEGCEKDYECKSEYCEEGKCSAKGVFNRIILWLRRLFGS